MLPDDVVRLGLTVARGIGPILARRIRDNYGGWSAAAEAAARSSVPERLRAPLARSAAQGERIRDACRGKGFEILFRGAPGWPERLECLPDAPEVLFLQGRRGLLHEPGVGIVGSRASSAAGDDWAFRAARRLAESGRCIVSGLARGIDAAAHRGALAASGDTIAVLGSGLDCHYPPENRALQEEIGRDGLLVSEFAPGFHPVAGNFPRRNRILSALSEGVVVVESRLRSGALVTARHALDQGREVYVVPGWPTSPLSTGPLALLRDGATPVRDADDLIADLGGVGGGAVRAEAHLARELESAGASTPGEVASALGIGIEEAAEKLAHLELLGLRPEPGGG